MKAFRLLFLSLLSIASLAISAAPPDAKLVDKVLEAYGGAEAWKNVAAVRETGKVLSAMQGEGVLVREWVRPDNLRVQIDYPRNSESRVVTGLTGLRDGEPVQGPQLDAMILQCARIALPALILDHRDDLRDGGRRESDGRELAVIEVPMTTYMSVDLEIDPATGRIVRSIGRASVPGTTARIEFIAVYGDFRTAGGLLFAFSEENIANGFRTGVTTLDAVEVRKAAK